jgi:hypothetical protein
MSIGAGALKKRYAARHCTKTEEKDIETAKMRTELSETHRQLFEPDYDYIKNRAASFLPEKIRRAKSFIDNSIEQFRIYARAYILARKILIMPATRQKILGRSGRFCPLGKLERRGCQNLHVLQILPVYIKYLQFLAL